MLTSPIPSIPLLFETYTLQTLCFISNQWLCHYPCSVYSFIDSNKVPPLCTDVHLLSARVQHCTRYFPANGLTNPDIFQPKNVLIPKSFLKISACWASPIWRSQVTNKQIDTHSLTDKCFCRVMIFILVKSSLLSNNNYQWLRHYIGSVVVSVRHPITY